MPDIKNQVPLTAIPTDEVVKHLRELGVAENVVSFPQQGDNFAPIAPDSSELAAKTHEMAAALNLLIAAQLPDAPAEVRLSAAVAIIRQYL